MPSLRHRAGGKRSYGEWCYVAGLFQALIAEHASTAGDLDVLDVGCGSGLLAIAADPVVRAGGSYRGIDVNLASIRFCERHYPDHASFAHLDVSNPSYAPTQAAELVEWPVETDSMDVGLALSVWTHLGEERARYYLGELRRVLRPTGVAIVTAFVLDDDYRASLPRAARRSAFHGTRQDRWVFDRPASDSGDWRTTGWASVPEDAIGITREALDDAVEQAGLRLEIHHPGTWKERPGLYFQDVLVLRPR